RAIEITSSIPNESGVGTFAVGCPSEAVEHRFLAGRIQLENGSIVEGAAILSRAIQSARCIVDQSRNRICSVRRASEGIQQSVLTGGIQLEYRSIVESTAKLTGAVETSLSVADQTCERIRPVPATLERMEHGERLRLRRRGDCREA